MPMPNRQRTGDRSWLDGSSRTWRWNEGTYEGRGSYDAVEVTPSGLTWYHWNHTHGDGGAAERAAQSFAGFVADGPLRECPKPIAAEVHAFLTTHGYLTATETTRHD